MVLWPGKVGSRVIHPRCARDAGDHGTKSPWWARRHQSMVDLQKGPWSQNGPTSPSYPMPIKIFFLGPFPTYKSLGCRSHSPIYQWSYPWSSLILHFPSAFFLHSWHSRAIWPQPMVMRLLIISSQFAILT